MNVPCDCGALKARTTHAGWCSTLKADGPKLIKHYPSAKIGWEVLKASEEIPSQLAVVQDMLEAGLIRPNEADNFFGVDRRPGFSAWIPASTFKDWKPPKIVDHFTLEDLGAATLILNEEPPPPELIPPEPIEDPQNEAAALVDRIHHRIQEMAQHGMHSAPPCILVSPKNLYQLRQLRLFNAAVVPQSGRIAELANWAYDHVFTAHWMGPIPLVSDPWCPDFYVLGPSKIWGARTETRPRSLRDNGDTTSNDEQDRTTPARNSWVSSSINWCCSPVS